MPRSPGQLTIGSFLKSKPPNLSPPLRSKGKKRQLSLSPNTPLDASSKKKNDSVYPIATPNDSLESSLAIVSPTIPSPPTPPSTPIITREQSGPPKNFPLSSLPAPLIAKKI